MNKLPKRTVLALISALTAVSGTAYAQSVADPAADTEPQESGTSAAPTASTDLASEETEDDEMVVLSPFTVVAEEDTGYLANATAVGGRVRTELRDVASSISVVTAQFLQDTKAVDNQSLLKYTPNTEVGGVYGNFAGVGNTYTRGAAEGETNMLRPNGNTRVRGLDSADNTRNLIKSDIPWNGFNVGRVDFQRGPNSILFGLGSPAGIINATTNTAGYKNGGSIENQIGSFGSMRNSLDYNQVLIEDTLAIRVDAVYDEQKYRQKPAFNTNRTVYGALRWDPKFFGENTTTIRASYENGDVKANRPHSLPPIDRITPFFDPNAFNRRLVDVTYDYQTGYYPWESGTARGKTYAQSANNWISGGAFGGINPQFFYNVGDSTPIRMSAGSINSEYAPGSIGAFIFSVPAGIADYGEYASNILKYGVQNLLPTEFINYFGAAGVGDKGFWKARAITNPKIFDFYNKLIHGNTKREWQNWNAYDITLEQGLLNDRISIQATYDNQSYHDGGRSILGWNPAITIDNNLYTTDYPSALTDLATLNPNAGRAYVSGSGGGNGRWTERENIILTAVGELRASDFLDDDSLLTRILGRHRISGVYHVDKYNKEDRSWALYAASNAWSELVGTGYEHGNGTGGLKGGDTVLNHTFYLSPSLMNSDGTNLNLSAITQEVKPPFEASMRYFDAHWKWPTDPEDPNYVDMLAPWENPVVVDGHGNPTDLASTQSNNPANYVGWVNATVPIYSAEDGDINQLYRSGSKLQTKTTSKGGMWQAYLFDDMIVGTIGYRKDRLEIRSGQAEPSLTGVALVDDYDLEPLDPVTGVSEGSSVSWGVVAGLPKSLRGKLPWGMDVYLGYSDGENTRVENRYGFSAKRLPDSKGFTEDVSLAVSMFDNRLSFKATYYDTLVKDANISSAGGSAAALGASVNWVWQIESRGTLSALVDLAGLEGDQQTQGWEWYWNWANMTGGFPKYSPWDVGNPWDPKTDPEFLANPETIKEKAAVASWLAQMKPQYWYDLYGIEIDVAKAQAGDYNNAVRGGQWRPSNYINIGDNGGLINGQQPTGSVDIRSTGWEFEVAGKPFKNFDISLNASKQFARQEKLGDDLVQFMEESYTKYTSPAGDLRLWWGGDTSFKDVFLGNIWTGYQFQAQTNGKLVNEMSPWRLNLSGTYRFDSGLLKGAYAGGSYRWQDGTILGYRLNDTLDNLDVDRPIWSKPQDWVDLWAGYSFKISEKFTWRTQINVRNVGQKAHLRAISVQPDGGPAGYRIEEGMTWLFSNTLSF